MGAPVADATSRTRLELDAQQYLTEADKAAAASKRLRDTVEHPVNDHLSPKLHDVQRPTDELHAPVQNLAGALSTLFAGTALAGGAGIVAGFATAIGSATDFEHMMSGVFQYPPVGSAG
jgi:hypothetical protein